MNHPLIKKTHHISGEEFRDNNNYNINKSDNKHKNDFNNNSNSSNYKNNYTDSKKPKLILWAILNFYITKKRINKKR